MDAVCCRRRRPAKEYLVRRGMSGPACQDAGLARCGLPEMVDALAMSLLVRGDKHLVLDMLRMAEKAEAAARDGAM